MQQFILGVLVGIVMMLTAEHFVVLHAATVAAEMLVNQPDNEQEYRPNPSTRREM